MILKFLSLIQKEKKYLWWHFNHISEWKFQIWRL